MEEGTRSDTRSDTTTHDMSMGAGHDAGAKERLMAQVPSPGDMKIDPATSKFPFSIVWTPLPLISCVPLQVPLLLCCCCL